MTHTRCHDRILEKHGICAFLVVLSCSLPIQAAQFFVVANNGTSLERYDTAAPGIQIASVALTGLKLNETLLGIDFRPADGLLYGISNQERLYQLNAVSGVATQVGTGTFPVPLGATYIGMDFTPVADRLRAVTSSGVNVRLNPNDASEVVDTTLTFASGDANFGSIPALTSLAYTHNAKGASVTTAYGIDANLDILVRVGGVGGSPSANGGLVTTIGPLGVNSLNPTQFDIGPDGVAYAVLPVNPGPLWGLYTLNLDTGHATFVNLVGMGDATRGLAVAPVGQVEFGTATDVVAEAGGTATVTVLRKAGSYGEITVQYATSNGTATAGSDYTATSGTLTFDVDETSKSFTIPITNDTTDEADETITVTLSNPGGGATIGTNSVLTLTITDDDAPASIIPGVNCGSGTCGAGMFTMLPAMALALRARRRGRR